MKKNAWLMLVLLALLGFFPAALRWLDPQGESDSPAAAMEPAAGVSRDGSTLPEADLDVKDEPARTQVVAAVPAASDAVLVPALEAPGPAAVRVRVVEARTGAPAVGAGLQLVQFHGGAHWDQVQRGLTDSKGEFVFDGLSEGLRTVYLSRVGVDGNYEAEGVEARAGETSEVVFTVDPDDVVKGRVVDESGAAVPGARIWVGLGPGGVARGQFAAQTDARGRFEVKYVGPTQFLSASAPGYAPSPSAASGIGQPFDDAGRLLLTLGARRGTIRGTVVDGAGTPIPSAAVKLGALQRQEPPGGGAPSYWSPPAQFRRTDEGGAFVFEDVAVGEHPIEARAAGTGLWSREVQVTDGGVTEVTIELVEGGTVKGRVLDAAGVPLAQASVSVQFPGDGALSRMEVQSDANGAYELRGVTPGDAPFEVASADWSRLLRDRVQVTSGQVTIWNPSLPDPKVLRGRVLSASGEPLRDWQVSTRPVVDGVVARVSMGTTVQADGSFQVSPDDYGDRFQISFAPPGGHRQPVRILEDTEIPAEAQDYLIPDADVPSASVVGRLVDGAGLGVRATVEVALKTPTQRSFEVRSGKDGRFHLRYLSEVAFVLTVATEEGSKRTIQSDGPLVKDETRDLGDIVLD